MNYLSVYTKFLKKFIKVRYPLKVVFDCSNGTAGLVLKKLFSNYHLLITNYINAKPDGRFPAHGPNPLAKGALSDLRRAVRRYRADLGAIFDADGDRVFFVDNLGRPLATDVAALLIGRDFRGAVILDVRSGYLARDYFRNSGRPIIESRVGHYFIKKLMRRKRVAFAAESSGHYYFSAKGGSASGGKDTFYFDSGILASIIMINQLSKIKDQGLTLGSWTDALPKYYRIPETNFRVKDKKAIMKRIEQVYKYKAWRIFTLDGLRMEFGPSPERSAVHSVAPQSGAQEWWFNLRPSNTEDLLRLNLEAKDKKNLKMKLRELKKLIK